MRYRLLFIATLLLATANVAPAQTKEENWSAWGNSHPSRELECDEYYWEPSPCPEVQIKQTHDHTSLYRHEGWDTAITCPTKESGIILSCMPYIPVKYFNGYYAVDPIPYDPPDTSFYINYNPATDANNPLKKKMDITADDYFAPAAVVFGDIFPFYFFGIQKTKFRLGDNGLVTFSDSDNSYDATTNNKCDWSCPVALPWTGSTDDGSKPFSYGVNCMRDAIYGVFQDTHVLPSTVSGHQGIYYGVIGEWPCRKIIATWNEIPLFSSQTGNRQTYQIVCYEGSNMIEVHIKRRAGNGPGGDNGTCTCNNQGVIGIQNASGNPQVKGAVSSSTRDVIPNSPAAFWPVGKNSYYSSESYTAYRFTPQGNTPKNYEWFFIQDGDTVRLTTDVTDTNGYYIPMGEGYDTLCPNLTRAVVKPKVPTKYYFHLWFNNANEDQYDLFDSIYVGIDTSNDMSLHIVDQPSGPKHLDICEGSTASLTLEYPATQLRDTVTYLMERISNGQKITLENAQTLTLGEWNDGTSAHSQAITLGAALPTQGRLQNKIDSIYITTSINFVSNCQNYDTMLVRIFPNFDTTVVVGICQGESYTWSANGQTYTTSTKADKELTSIPGCDSIVHLDLTVMDVSYTVDTVKDCKPYTWLNGQTYYTSNAATAATDTLMMKNIWNCDSIVQLNFIMLPVEARIRSDREFFDYDHLDAQLNDISLNNSTRTWVAPGGNTSNSTTFYYSIQPEMDEAQIWLIATSPYGCVDTTDIVIPMRKESFWMPNAFMPDNAAGNNTFGSTSLQTVWQEMFIYNRHGILVYQCEGADCQWDGKDLNGNPSPQGVYTYFIRYSNEYKPKQVHVLRGTVTLIR